MGRIDKQEEIKLKNQRWIAGKYYDYPDGEDLGGKLWFTTKISALLGTVTGAVATSMSPVPKTTLLKVIRNFQFIVPAVTASTVFTMVTYASTNMRGKDDQWNHAIGGLLGGGFLGMLHSKRIIAFGSAAACSLVALGLKLSVMEKGLYGQPVVKTFQPFYKRTLENLSFVEDRKGNWTSTPIS